MAAETILHDMGITPRYHGHRLVLMALEMAGEDDGRLKAMTEGLYMPIGQTLGIPYREVERNIRTVIRLAWERNPAYMQTLAGEQLAGPPSAGAFIKMICRAVKRGRELEQ